jgi:uncharacterized protein (DUF2267 family)
MDYDRFITIVARSAGIDRESAEEATRATLQTLADRIDGGEARQLATELPAELAPYIGKVGGAERFGFEEFLRRVAEREGVDVDTAEHHATLVFAVLGQAVDARELHDVQEQLPGEFAPLLPRGPHVEIQPPDVFLQKVMDRARIDRARAEAATNAVLETLAERLDGGEVEDLVERLPLELRAPLKHGDARTGGEPTPMSVDEFVARVAEREGVGLDLAFEHVRVVLETLREAVGDNEFFDITAQLPESFNRVLAHA